MRWAVCAASWRCGPTTAPSRDRDKYAIIAAPEAPDAAHAPCPDCHAPGSHWLESASRDARVDYFRCSKCGHIWNTPKPGEPGEQRDVTQRRQPGQRSEVD